MYEKKDVSPVKATDLLVFGQIYSYSILVYSVVADLTSENSVLLENGCLDEDWSKMPVYWYFCRTYKIKCGSIVLVMFIQ